jgi:hypothetical protein
LLAVSATGGKAEKGGALKADRGGERLAAAYQQTAVLQATVLSKVVALVSEVVGTPLEADRSLMEASVWTGRCWVL